jgi:DNA ligase 1
MQQQSHIYKGFQQFANLVQIVGNSTKTNEKLEALQQFFTHANDADKVWTIAIFSGRRPKRLVSSTLLQTWCMELTNIKPWLFEECYNTVGDLAETITLLLSNNTNNSTPNSAENTAPLAYYLQQFIVLEKATEQEKKSFVIQCWQQLQANECFVLNKLITGGFRIGVSQNTMVNALAKTLQIEASAIAHKISGNWSAATISWQQLLLEKNDVLADSSKPYPFYLAYAVELPIENLGAIEQWQAEWKWDGIRGQIIKRNNQLFVWSRGEELVTEKFPEYEFFVQHLPNGTVLDGEIVAIQQQAETITPAAFAILQTRIGRKNITKKILQQAPVGFIAYDVLEYNGIDIRQQPLHERRKIVEQIFATCQHPHFYASPLVQATNWQQLQQIQQQARQFSAEGIMLKRLSSVYQVGRKVGDWYKWKIAPLVIDAVMIYAQKGHGRRSNLYTDYTFAVADGDKLVTFTKAYSGLTDKDFAEVDAFVKANSIEKFGPVRTVKPELVFEIAFEGIAASNRHKSGVALRFPRINRWRKDKPVSEINTLHDLQQLLQQYGHAAT